MAELKLHYVIWRDGRPRFQPSGRERSLGFKGEDLRHADGRWFSFEEARAWSAGRYAEIAQARSAGRRRPVPAGNLSRKGGTVSDLLDDWLAALDAETNPATRLAPDTLHSYRAFAVALRWKPETLAARKGRRDRERLAARTGAKPPSRTREEFADTPVAAIDKIALKDFHGYLVRTRGAHAARGSIAAFSAAYTWGGLDRRWRLGPNPRFELSLPQPKGRIVIYSDAELRALDTAATALGRPSIGDALWLGVFTSQRQRDRLLLKDEGLVDGRRMFRQSKTGRLVAMPETPMLAARLEAARARVAALKLRLGTRPDTVVVDEATGLPYVQSSYRHEFSRVRAAAAAAMPSLAGKRDQDLRDTAVTWLARSGCTMAEICAITGHSSQSVQVIIEHYLGSTRELADQAIAKLTAWMAREGIAV
jgi:hypothetical protein